MPRKQVALLLVMLAVPVVLPAADQPQWGQAWSRNMISIERGLPDSFDPKTGRNIKWIAKLGTESHSSPVISGGRVFIGTNNGEPRDPRHQGDRGVLMCLDERNGSLLWQLVVPKREEDPYFDWPRTGISSPATVEGNRAYIVDNRGTVLCLDAQGLANGNDGPFRDEGAYLTPPKTTGAAPAKPTPGAEIKPGPVMALADAEPLKPGPLDADIVWMFDQVGDLGVWPHDGAHSSILIHGDYLYVNTGTGVDNTHRKIRSTNAPSLIVLDKRTGKLVARDDEHIAPNIFHATWSAPSLGVVNGRPLVFFTGGNGMVYAFEPIAKAPARGEVTRLRKVFQFDMDPAGPKEAVHRFTQNKLDGPCVVHGATVFFDDRLFVAGGGDLWWGKNAAWLKCIDAAKTGDITSTAEVWSYPLGQHVMSTPAVQDGLAFIADTARNVHCVDARTGKPFWTHECKGLFWASPFVADGKVFIGSRRGDFWVFAADKEKKILSTLELGAPVSGTAAAANGVLYVASMTHLYAVAVKP
jgi:outer membrane protein assembly factor BamB